MLLTLYLQLRIVTKSKILPFRNEKIVHCLLNTFFLNYFFSLALEGDNNSNSNSSSGATTTETLQRPTFGSPTRLQRRERAVVVVVVVAMATLLNHAMLCDVV